MLPSKLATVLANAATSEPERSLSLLKEVSLALIARETSAGITFASVVISEGIESEFCSINSRKLSTSPFSAAATYGPATLKPAPAASMLFSG
ncbi:unannotated protein [freshwater metagenome]|uniref:Unannotated protein n=1 Tax=freshwater metagenome TaxID=449393 RepID=A0A6J6WNS8_9ZZZZ